PAFTITDAIWPCYWSGAAGRFRAGERDAFPCERPAAKVGTHQPPLEYQESFFASQFDPCWQIPHSCGRPVCACHPQDSGTVVHSATQRGAASDHIRNYLRHSARHILHLVWVVGSRLPGRVAKLGKPPEDVPAGFAAGIQGDRRQPADSRENPRAAAADAPPPHEGRRKPRFGGYYES